MKQAAAQRGKYRVIEHRSYSVIEGPFYHTEQKCLGEYDTICEAWDRIREARAADTKETGDTARNKAMPSCQGCGLEHQSKNAICSICARTHRDYWHEQQWPVRWWK